MTDWNKSELIRQLKKEKGIPYDIKIGDEELHKWCCKKINDENKS